MKYFLSCFLLLGLCGQMLEAINPDQLTHVQKRETAPGVVVKDCTCVPYYQCGTTEDVDISKSSTESCESYLEVCCDADSITRDTIKQQQQN